MWLNERTSLLCLVSYNDKIGKFPLISVLIYAFSCFHYGVS